MAKDVAEAAISNNLKPLDTGRKNSLFDNDNASFIEASAELLLQLGVLWYKFNLIINNDGRLRNSALDYRRLSLIKNNIEANRGNMRYIIDMLSQHLPFIERHDKTFAQLISNYGPAKKKQMQLLSELSNLAGDTSKLSANIDILLEQADLLNDTLMASKVKARLLLIKRYLEEIRALNFDLEDINNWNMHFHNDITFFTERIKIYFEGGGARDRMQFTALDEFKDEKLKKDLFESRELRVLFGIAQWTYNTEAQMDYISELRLFLEKDIENNQWVRNQATSTFYKNIELYADIFRKKFLNNPFANSLIKNKSKIGEQPFEWINLLQKMKQALEDAMPRKNIAIDNAKNHLYNVFRSRVESLKSSIIGLSAQLNQLLSPEIEDASLLKQIQEGVKRIERVINKLWDKRRKKFKNISARITSLSIYVMPTLDRFIETVNIIKEGTKIAQNNIALVQFGESTNKIVSIAGPRLQPRHFELLGMLGFNFARMGDIVESNNQNEELIKQKDALSRNYDLAKLKISIKELTELYMEFIEFLNLVNIGVDIKEFTYKTNNFMREYYG